MWAVQGCLEERVQIKEKERSRERSRRKKKTQALRIESLPWHTFVEHLPALHHRLGSLAELLSIEHEGEHGHRPLALYANSRCSHQGDVLNQMRGTYHTNFGASLFMPLVLISVTVAASYLDRYNEDFSSSSSSTGHREGFGRIYNCEDIPNLYLPRCLLQTVPLLAPNLALLHRLFAAQGWAEYLKPDVYGGWLAKLNQSSHMMNCLCVGPSYGCFTPHNQ